MVGVLIGVYLARVGLNPAGIGLVVSVGLAAAALATATSALWADRSGRKGTLITLALRAAGGGLLVAAFSRTGLLAAGAFVGMLNGMGRDRGAALALEQAIIPATAPDHERTRAIAWYNVLQDSGHAIGSLMSGLPVLFRRYGHLGEIDSLRWALALYAALMLLSGLLYLGLSSAIEAPAQRTKLKIAPESRGILWRLCSLFAIDSLGGGFLTAALLTYFFFKRFGVDEGVMGPLFAGARVMNALSHLGAAWLAARIGLVNTMVFTHVPTSLLLVTVAFAPSLAVAAALFLLREGLVEMDVPTRQSYVMAVVRPEERAFASGITHLVRMGGWAIAPSLAGWLMQGYSLATPLYIGAGMKIAYDVMLYVAFRGKKAPEELASESPARSG
jgi:MFS family permease